jgi:hypothetical protein
LCLKVFPKEWSLRQDKAERSNSSKSNSDGASVLADDEDDDDDGEYKPSYRPALQRQTVVTWSAREVSPTVSCDSMATEQPSPKRGLFGVLKMRSVQPLPRLDGPPPGQEERETPRARRRQDSTAKSNSRTLPPPPPPPFNVQSTSSTKAPQAAKGVTATKGCNRYNPSMAHDGSKGTLGPAGWRRTTTTHRLGRRHRRP